MILVDQTGTKEKIKEYIELLKNKQISLGDAELHIREQASKLVTVRPSLFSDTVASTLKSERYSLAVEVVDTVDDVALRPWFSWLLVLSFSVLMFFFSVWLIKLAWNVVP